MDFYEFTIKRTGRRFVVYIGNKYYGSYETVLEAANAVDELMKEGDKENTNASNN